MKILKKFILAILLTIPVFFTFAFISVYGLWLLMFFDPYDDDFGFGLTIINKIKKICQK